MSPATHKPIRRLPDWFVYGVYKPGPLQHPWMWVRCYACGSVVPMMKDADGGAVLPDGWSTIVPMKDGKKLVELYASRECAFRAGVLAGARWNTSQVKITTATGRPVESMSVKFQVPKPKQE